MSWLERRWYSEKNAPVWLYPLEKLYRILAAHKAKKDKQQVCSQHVPVIVVGNISVGGTGKTPLVLSLLSELKKQGFKPGIISRGYKSKAPEYPYHLNEKSTPEQAGDEPYLLYKRGGCPVVIDANRCSAAKLLLQKNECDLIISDDGLQHHQLGRDIEIVVIDGQRGLGNGHCIPAGPLRESAERLNSVDFIVSNGPLTRGLGSGNKAVSQMDLVTAQFVNCADPEQVAPIDYFKGQHVHAVAGIGNPERFFKTLENELGISIERHPMRDHSAYTREDVTFTDKHLVIMTEKDAVKVKEFANHDHWYLEVSARLPDNFMSQLINKLEQVKEHKGMKKNG